MEFYKEISQYYDRITAGGYYNYLETFKKYKKEIDGKDILEIGVGTGNLALLFAEKGYNVDGIDVSKSMLALAKHKLAGRKTRLWNIPIEKFNSKLKYNAVISSAAVFVLIKSSEENFIETYILKSEIKKALKNIFYSLSDEGKFIFDFYPEHDTKKRFFDFGDYKYEFEIIKKKRMEDFVKVHNIKKNGKIIASSKIPKIRLPFADFESLAKDAGFLSVEIKERDGLVILSKTKQHQKI